MCHGIFTLFLLDGMNSICIDIFALNIYNAFQFID